jgi:hypothetical protein
MTSKFGQRLSVVLFAAVVLAVIVGISFVVGYMVGKLLL